MSGFLEGNDRGASCLGPHSGLTMKEDRFKAALAALSNPSLTRIVLVTRPDRAALAEAARTSGELAALGLSNQHLVVNGSSHYRWQAMPLPVCRSARRCGRVGYAGRLAPCRATMSRCVRSTWSACRHSALSHGSRRPQALTPKACIERICRH